MEHDRPTLLFQLAAEHLRAVKIMNKVSTSALAVLSNAVLVWNTVRMTEILRARGPRKAPESPLGDVKPAAGGGDCQSLPGAA